MVCVDRHRRCQGPVKPTAYKLSSLERRAENQKTATALKVFAFSLRKKNVDPLGPGQAMIIRERVLRISNDRTDGLFFRGKF